MEGAGGKMGIAKNFRLNEGAFRPGCTNTKSRHVRTVPAGGPVAERETAVMGVSGYHGSSRSPPLCDNEKKREEKK
ncbi:Uncharacterized protein DAT39_002873 [Clarias magur]|uniref:Uncharacterized protein n=1 Tax=Clarias magur TaxID=1594786 RepID=A0A8J4U029_CLAMG|nr:Uncharacterized protein DAT39_002873 [Clarias magur]